MNYLIIDLEWNGSWSKKAHGYFNEIIELGAVKLDEHFHEIDRLQVKIRPTVSKKLSGIVTDLTNITQEELEDGTTFPEMVKAFLDFAGNAPFAVLTWSTTDLLVLMENCHFYFGESTIPGLTYYMDFQAYVQKQMGISSGQQLGLAKAGEMLSIPEDSISFHRALDDSLLTAQILYRIVSDREAFTDNIRTVNEEFYRRLTFKAVILSDIGDTRIKRSDLQFDCPVCNAVLKQKTKWRFFSRAFHADLFCSECEKKYIGWVQCRLQYDGLSVRRKLTEKVNTDPENAENGKAEKTV